MKNYIIYTILILSSYTAISQQLGSSSLMYGTQLRQNPAFNAFGDEMVFDGYFKTQWIGFSGAPASGYISAQYPFLSQNMGAGANLHFDNTGPITKVGLQLNYAYKLKELLRKRDQLSLGLSVDVQQYSFLGANQIVNDVNDPFYGMKETSFFPTMGIGAFYMSSTRMYKENVVFGGFSTNQVFATDVLVNNVDQNRERHYNAIIGGRFFNYNSFIEPMISANLVKPDVINVLYGARYEMEGTFWAGLGYESAGLASFQGGVILTDLGPDEDGTMRLGIMANTGVSTRVQKVGPSIEFYLSYTMKQ